jgi:hypothetical protein
MLRHDVRRGYQGDGILGFLTWALSSPDGVPDEVLNDNIFQPLPSDWKAAIIDAFVNGTDLSNLRIAWARTRSRAFAPAAPSRDAHPAR